MPGTREIRENIQRRKEEQHRKDEQEEKKEKKKEKRFEHAVSIVSLILSFTAIVLSLISLLR